MRRFLDYYRQFQELSPEEVSRELRERRAEERARELTELPGLDLTGVEWHEPPDAEAVNAATYALRRALNAPGDGASLQDAVAARHGVAPAQVAVGHGAGELLRAAFRAVAAGGEVAVAWPGWGPLPRLVHEAGGRPVPVPLPASGSRSGGTEALLETGARVLVVGSPGDPTGGVLDVVALAGRLDPAVWLVVDAALVEFAPEDPTPGVVGARERAVVVRSFSKAHAMAGLRVGYAVGGSPDVMPGLAPVGGLSAPAEAAALWALEHGEPVVARRRAAAARERARLAAGLAGTPFSFAEGHGPLVWLASAEHDGRALAALLAAQRIYVTPGAAWGDDAHVRITLRDAAATDRLLAALGVT